MDLDSIVLVKPAQYEELGKTAAEGWFSAEQSIISALAKNTKNGMGIIPGGEDLLKNNHPYSKNNLPATTPVTTNFTLDDIKFEVETAVNVPNPPYETAFTNIIKHIENLVLDFKDGIVRPAIRTIDDEPYIELNYLMRRGFRFIGDVQEYGLKNELKVVNVPEKLETMSLDKLVLPIELLKGFDIKKPGAAETWYLAKRFYDEVQADTVKPIKEAVVQKSGDAEQYWTQVEGYLFIVQNISSPQRQFAKVLNRIYRVPKPSKKKGELPVIIDHNNYLAMLEAMKGNIDKKVNQWKVLDNNIGELTALWYGIGDNAKVQEQFPFLPEYMAKKRDDRIFVSVQAVYDRLKALEQDYMSNRMLRKHTIQPIV